MKRISSKQLKVIIVGAEVTGLVLANLLDRANIAFILVEAHPDIERPTVGSYGYGLMLRELWIDSAAGTTSRAPALLWVSLVCDLLLETRSRATTSRNA